MLSQTCLLGLYYDQTIIIEFLIKSYIAEGGNLTLVSYKVKVLLGYIPN